MPKQAQHDRTPATGNPKSEFGNRNSTTAILRDTRGSIKIRLSIPYAFTLLSRVYPERKPDVVLSMVEGLQSVPVVLWQVAAAAGLWFELDRLGTLGLALIGTVLGTLIPLHGLFLIPGLPTVAMWWSRMPWLLHFFGPPVLAYFLRKWDGLLTWVIAYILASILHYVTAFFGRHVPL